MRWLDGITVAKDTNLGKLWELVRDRLSLACCSPRGHVELDTIWQLNNNNNRNDGFQESKVKSFLFRNHSPIDNCSLWARTQTLTSPPHGAAMRGQGLRSYW